MCVATFGAEPGNRRSDFTKNKNDERAVKKTKEDGRQRHSDLGLLV